MVGDLVTSEAALPVTESDAFKKQDSDGADEGTWLERVAWVPLTLSLVRPLGRGWEANRIPGGRLPGSKTLGPEGDQSPGARTEAMFTDEKLNTGPPSTLHARRADSESSRHVGNRPPVLLTSFPAPGLHREFPEHDTGQRTPVPQELSLQLKVTHDDWHPSSCRLPEPLRQAA